MGFEPEGLVFEREKTVRALDRGGIVIGFYKFLLKIFTFIYIHCF
jgi:hypothetical protein